MKKSNSINSPCVIMTGFTSHQLCFLEPLINFNTQGCRITMFELIPLVIACLRNIQNDVEYFSFRVLITTYRQQKQLVLKIWMTKKSQVLKRIRMIKSSRMVKRNRMMKSENQGEQVEEEPTEKDANDDYILENGFNVSSTFRRYKNKSEQVAKEKGFYVDGNLHQVLALSHVLLLKESENPQSLIDDFGLNNLKKLHEKLKDVYINENISIATSTFNKITESLRGMSSITNRKEIKKLLYKASIDATDDDDKMIDIIINCLNKLPAVEGLEEIGEAELIGKYLDPVLSPLFHDPEKQKEFKWLNLGVVDTDVIRPDGNIYEIEQRMIKHSTGFVEVKPDKSRNDPKKTHEDTLRLVNFCKDVIDKKNIKAMMAVQAVGFLITIYIISLEAPGLYIMTELFSFNVPKCISELPMLVMNLD